MRLGLVSSPLLAALALGACNRAEPSPASWPDAQATPHADDPHPPGPLKLGVPIEVVMLGTINEASFVVFRAGTSDAPLSDEDWRKVGAAAITLIADASVISLPGTGPKDTEWTSIPEWRSLSADMQAAAFDVGKAAAAKDAKALQLATARLAQVCQSCHERLSGRLISSPPASPAND